MGNKKNKRKSSKRTKSNSVQLELRADTLENVFQYLPMKDLCRAAQVCKLWNLVANVEMKNRGPEILFTEKEFQDSLLNKITVKPYLTICMRNMLNLGEVINYAMKSSGRTFLGKSIFFLVFHSQTSARNLRSPSKDRMNLPHLILPQTYRKSEFAFACYINEDEHHLSVELERFCKEEVRELRPKDESTHTTYLLFSSCNCTRTVLGHLLQGVNHKQYTLWGGECDCIGAYDPDSLHVTALKEVRIVLISIKGPTVVSWSMIIPHCANEDEFKQKLLNFKSTLSLRRFSIGLIIGPEVDAYPDSISLYFECSKVSKIFEQIFPGTPFLNTRTWSKDSTQESQDYFGVNSTTDDFSLPQIVSNSISIIIISYN